MAKIVDMVDAVKVQFLKPIFEDDFVERGMTAWLTGIEYNDTVDCYELFFDFSDFEEINDKYFRESYYPNVHTALLPKKPKYTAKEAGMYNPKYSVYLSVGKGERDDDLFQKEIYKHIQVVY